MLTPDHFSFMIHCEDLHMKSIHPNHVHEFNDPVYPNVEVHYDRCGSVTVGYYEHGYCHDFVELTLQQWLDVTIERWLGIVAVVTEVSNQQKAIALQQNNLNAQSREIHKQLQYYINW